MATRIFFLLTLILIGSLHGAEASPYTRLIEMDCAIEAGEALLNPSLSFRTARALCLKVAVENATFYQNELKTLKPVIKNTKLWHKDRAHYARSVIQDLNRRIDGQMGILPAQLRPLLAPDLTVAIDNAKAAISNGNYDYDRLILMSDQAIAELEQVKSELQD